MSNISPIDPERACTDCGVTVVEWDPADKGCVWPDGKTGCWSGFSADGKNLHVCRTCGEKRGYPLLDRTCPKCKAVFESADAVDEHFGECDDARHCEGCGSTDIGPTEAVCKACSVRAYREEWR